MHKPVVTVAIFYLMLLTPTSRIVDEVGEHNQVVLRVKA